MTHEYKEIIRVEKESSYVKQDLIAIEWPFTIIVNGEQFITLLATPLYLEELAVGFAFNEGLLSHKSDINELRLSQDSSQVELFLSSKIDLALRLAKTRVLTTGCGKGSSYYRALDSLTLKPVINHLTLNPEQIGALMTEVNKSASNFVETGSVHSAALAQETLIAFREDVARHNSVDKLVGNLILNDNTNAECAILTSGRITSELVIKAARANIGIIISRSAPSTLAVELATDLNVTLVGFVRGNRFNVYCNPFRIDGCI